MFDIIINGLLILFAIWLTIAFIFGVASFIWDVSGKIFNPKEDKPTYQLNKYYLIVNDDMFEQLAKQRRED